MATYRLSRNLEASLIDFLVEELATDWSTFNIRVVKAFTQVYDGTLPVICVQVITPNSTKLEVGSSTWLKNIEVAIRIFAKDDGLRLDLSDWTRDKLEESIDYNEYVITSGVAEKETVGKVQVNTILQDEKELVNSESLAQEDKFRHIIRFVCRVAKR